MTEQNVAPEEQPVEEVPDAELAIHTPPADTEGTAGIVVTTAPDAPQEN